MSRLERWSVRIGLVGSAISTVALALWVYEQGGLVLVVGVSPALAVWFIVAWLIVAVFVNGFME